MGFTEVLTIVFVVMKLIGVIDWSWLVVFLPEIIAAVFYFALIIVALAPVTVATFGGRLQKRLWDQYDGKEGDA